MVNISTVSVGCSIGTAAAVDSTIVVSGVRLNERGEIPSSIVDSASVPKVADSRLCWNQRTTFDDKERE